MKKIFIVLAFIFCSVLYGMEESTEDYVERKLSEAFSLLDKTMLLSRDSNGASKSIDDEELFLTEADLVDVLYPNTPKPNTKSSSRGLKRSFEMMINSDHVRDQDFDDHKDQDIKWQGKDEKECSLCGKIIANLRYKKSHELWHRKTVEKNKRCDACKYAFESRSGYYSHNKSTIHNRVISYRAFKVESISCGN